MNAQFILPEFYRYNAIYGTLAQIIQETPDVLLPNTELYTLFGVFPGCIWNGGGVSIGGNILRDQVEDTIMYYNEELNIPLTFTFTNPILEEKHYYDTYCNMIAEVGNNGKNAILVSNLEFEKYLRENYKNYRYCRSILASENIPYTLDGPYGKYDISVMKRGNNNNWEYLNTIPMEDRSSIELLCNDPCIDNCPRIYSHYSDMARAQLEYSTQVEGLQCSIDPELRHFLYKYIKSELTSYISRDMIDKEYLPKGFCKFKCSGRSSIINCMFNIVNYLIKPEYREDILAMMLNSLGIT